MKQLLIVALLATSINAVAQDWNSNPNNWNNNPSNWQNSPNNWQNSPNNWQNNPSRFGNERLIRDTDGNVNGYAVPKADGGVNFYDNQGNRRGYLPSTR